MRFTLPKLPRKPNEDEAYIIMLTSVTVIVSLALLGQWGVIPKVFNSASPFAAVGCANPVAARPYFGSVNCVINSNYDTFKVGLDEGFQSCATCNKHDIKGLNVEFTNPTASCGYLPTCANAIYAVSSTGSWIPICDRNAIQSWANVQTACNNELATMSFADNAIWHFEVWAYNNQVFLTGPPANPTAVDSAIAGKSSSVSGIKFVLNAKGEHFVASFDSGNDVPVLGTEGCTSTELMNAYIKDSSSTVRQNQPLSLADVQKVVSAWMNGALQLVSTGTLPVSTSNVLSMPLDSSPDEGYWVFYKWEQTPLLNFGTYQGSRVYCDNINHRLLTTTNIETSGACYMIPYSTIPGVTPECCNAGDCLYHGAGWTCDTEGTFTCTQEPTACPLGDYQCGTKNCFRQGTNTFVLSGSFCISGQCTNTQKASECCTASDCGSALNYDCVYDEVKQINKCTPKATQCPAGYCCKGGGTYQAASCESRGYAAGTQCCTTTNEYMAPLDQCKASCESEKNCAWYDVPCQIQKIIEDLIGGALMTIKTIVGILAFFFTASIAWGFLGASVKDNNVRLLATVVASLVVAFICYSLI